jgi:hypothetical protein
MRNNSAFSESRSSTEQSETSTDGGSERAELVARVIASEHFAKSPQVAKFLHYVCQQVIQGTSDGINEQVVGMEVFGRSSGYDSNEDNIVRAHATRLRQKLNAYFSNEGRSEPLRIVVPKGSYIPVFGNNSEAFPPVASEPSIARKQATPAGSDSVEDRHETGQAARHRNWHHVLQTLTCCFLCIGVTFLVVRKTRSVAAGNDALPNHHLWTVLSQEHHLSLVPGDSSLVLYNNVSESTVSISGYISGQYRAQPDTRAVIPADELGKIARRRLTSIVDLQMTSRILRRPEFTDRAKEISVVYARDLHVENLKTGNVILFGSSEANPWVKLFESTLNFVMIPDQKTKVFSIYNRNPRGQEQSKYVSNTSTSLNLAYALVSCVPNLSGDGHVLLIQGTGMAGTQAAADFVLDNNSLSDLLWKSHAQDTSLPNFEILLQTSNLSGSSPNAQVIAYRVY